MPAAASPPVSLARYIGRGAPTPGQGITMVPFGWPDETTTGYVNAPGYPGSLTTFSGTIASNTTYSFKTFSGGYEILANTSNVTFYGCEFDQDGGVGNMCISPQAGCSDITFSYCTFQPTGFSNGPPPGGITLSESYQYGIFAGSNVATLLVEYCNFWGFGNASLTVDGGTQANPNIYKYNYIHDPTQVSPYHVDGLGSPGGGTESYTQIIGNNIQVSAGTGATQAIAYQNTPGPSSWSNFTITGNLLGGYGYTVAIVSGTTGSPTASDNITFTGNTFSTYDVIAFGPLYDATFVTSPGSVWRNNKWLVIPGGYWGHAQYNGYFWIPGTTSTAGPGLDELAAGLVSATDYTG